MFFFLSVLVSLILCLGIYFAYITLIPRPRFIRQVQKNGKFKSTPVPPGAYDCVIVGAGPSGSTMGYYVAKSGGKVALLEKKKFPRDKYCGDAVCTPAIRILEEMGVMQELIDNNEAKFADAGGFVSPSGISYIGASEKKLGEAAACAVKRTHLDMRIAFKALSVGADLKQEFNVENAQFSKEDALWTVTSEDGTQIKGRVLVCADGANSRLASKLGYVTEPPKGVCSRSFIEGGTHNANFDGVCFYQPESLPGYSAIFRHPNDELNFCYYLIPCGDDGKCGDVTESDLPRLHENALKNDPFISKALGPNAKVERMKAAPLRLGGQGVKTTYDDHLLIIGDAAGHIDPLTGEGIHNAMMGGQEAAQTMISMIEEGDYSSMSTRVYEDRWHNRYGHDFDLSQRMATTLYHFPILLDACASEMQRKGDAMMAKWAEIMTGMQSKSYFLKPSIALPMAIAVVREFASQKLMRRKCGYYQQ